MYILDIFKIASSAFATRCMILISAPNNHSFLLVQTEIYLIVFYISHKVNATLQILYFLSFCKCFHYIYKLVLCDQNLGCVMKICSW